MPKLLSQTNMVLLVSLLVIAARVLFSVDFTDETLYLEQAKSLVLRGRYFVDDLGMQQIVYLYTYPVLYASKILLGGWDYSLIMMRLLLVAIAGIIAILAKAYLKLSVRGFAMFVLGLVAMLNLQPIFNISYNTIALLSSVAFLVAVQSQNRTWTLAFFCSMGAISYPTLIVFFGIGAIISEIVLGKGWVNFLVKIALFAFLQIAVLFVLGAIDPDSLRSSIVYTSYFHVVTGARDTKSIISISLLIVFGYFIYFFAERITKNPEILFLPLIMSTCALLLTERYYMVSPMPGYALSMTLGFLLRTSVAGKQPEGLLSVALLPFILAIILSFTSGNGFGSFMYGAAIALPMMSVANLRRRNTCFLFLFAVLTVSCCKFIRFPYSGDLPLERRVLVSTPVEFKGIFLSASKAKAIRYVQSEVSPLVVGKRVTVFGGNPWLYTVLGKEPCTLMLFQFTSFPAPKAAKIFESKALECSKDSTLIFSEPPHGPSWGFINKMRENASCVILKDAPTHRTSIGMGLGQTIYVCKMG